MLVLTVRRGERIFLGEDIELMVVGVLRERARIGVSAPQGVSILRQELETKPLAAAEPPGAIPAANIC